MSKHVDLIAVGVLLLGFACAARLHELASIGMAQTRAFRVLQVRPIMVAPPPVPPPSFRHLPALHY